MLERFVCWWKGHEDVFYFGDDKDENTLWAKVRCSRCGRTSVGIKVGKSNQSEG